MRIGVDADNLATNRRGMGLAVRQILQALRRFDDAKIILVVRAGSDASSLWFEFDYPTIIASELARDHLDAVWFPWSGMRFAPYAPAIVTVHDPFAFTYPNPNPVVRWREQSPIRRAFKEADRIFAVSRWTGEELYRLLGVDRKRIRVVPNAIDPFWHPVTPSIREQYMLLLAGPEERKNVRMLLAAYQGAFADAGPKLIVSGKLNARDERAFDKMRASAARVHPSDEELRDLYSGAFAVLIPSLAEGFGLTALEAMACGAPVVSSNTTALPETCDGAAMLVRPDENAWRGALRTIVMDENLCRDLQMRGLARVARIDQNGPAKALLIAPERWCYLLNKEWAVLETNNVKPATMMYTPGWGSH